MILCNKKYIKRKNNNNKNYYYNDTIKIFLLIKLNNQ